MTFETAVARMQAKTDPYFGIIVENKPECWAFLDKLQLHMPPSTVSNMPPLKVYAFSEGKSVVAVTLSRYYRDNYNRWATFDTSKEMLSYTAQHPDRVDWIMWHDVHECDINFDDLM